MPPPEAERRPHVHLIHGDERPDDFHWLRDRDDPATIAYLEAENAYAEEALAPTKELQERLFDEFRARIQETDLSVPARKGPYEYYLRTVEGQQYPIYCRRPVGGGDEDVLLDENLLAEGHDFHALGEVTVSPDHSLLAWSEDVEGDEDYTLRVRDLLTGKDLDDEIPNTYYGLEWSNDGRTVFYTTLDHAQRPWRLYRHVVGTPVEDDRLLHQEDDERFFVHLSKTQSERFIVLSLDSKVTSEVWVLDADASSSGELRCIEPRQQHVEYSIDHEGDRFFVLTNADGAVNFKLMEAPVSSPGRGSWREVVGHRDDVKLVSMTAFARHLVVTERAEGVRRLTVRRHADGTMQVIEQPEAVSTTALGDNLEFDTDVVRFEYSSMVTPRQVVDHDMTTGERTVLKEEPVLGGYEPSEYETGREWAVATDGTRVPISWVARRDRDRAGPGPVLLYGYGSYESSSDPRFSPFRLSLLDRGFVFAIAHVRGGGELGRLWYEQGKFLHKRNTFEDLIASAEHLVSAGWTTPERLAIWGGSAGGLLVGAAVNMRPDLFGAVVAEVPFVDVVTTMLDESLPLTVTEWEEWGNPNEAPFYEYMKSYSPYDNVRAQAYPPILVTAGLNDPRVSYHEPAKWVAKLRSVKTDDNLLVLKTEMGAGHGGPSGRYEAWRELAMIYAFVLTTLAAA